MSRKDTAITVIRLFSALYRTNTWRQNELAKELELSKVETLRGWLEAIAADTVVPLEESRDGSWVYWSVPSSFIPGGIVVPQELAVTMLTLCMLAPPIEGHGRVLDYLARAMPKEFKELASGAKVLAGGMSAVESRVLTAVQMALARGTTLFVRYLSNSEDPGNSATRVLSVHRLDLRSARRRLVAYCHTKERLKWFRLDRFLSARDSSKQAKYQQVPAEEVERYFRHSTGGFHDDSPTVHCEFLITRPTADWAGSNLPDFAEATETKDGLEVVIDTNSLTIVACFVLQLNGGVVIHTPELKARVRELAQAALDATA